MKIKSKLVIIALLPALSLLISSSFHLYVSSTADRARNKIILADHFSQDLSILTVITLEHYIHYEERAHIQWIEKFDELSNQFLIIAEEFRDPSESRLVSAIDNQLKTTEDLFQQYGPHMSHEKFNQENENWHSFAERLTNRIQQELQLSTQAIHGLRQLNHQALLKHDKDEDLLMLVFFLLLALIIPGMVIFINRSLGKPIQGLHEGFKIISAGNLHYRIGLSGKDEISQLGQAFDRMAEQQLAATTALRESERRLRDMLENIQLAALMLDTHGTIISCNDHLLSLTAYQKNELIGQNWFELCIPEGQEVKNRFLSSLIDGEIIPHYENEVLTKNGELRTIRWNNTILRDQNEIVIGTTSIGEDITQKLQAEKTIRLMNEELEERVRQRTEALMSIADELSIEIEQRKRVESELRSSEEKFSKIFFTSPISLVITDIDTGRIIETNNQFSILTGYSREELIGHTTIELGIWDDPDIRSKVMAEIRNRGECGEVQTKVKTRTGDLRNISYIGRTLDIGENLTVLSLVTDTTEQRQLEAELRKAKDQAETANRSKSVFLANMSHEIRTPMNTIIALSYLTLQTELQPRQKEFLKKIDVSAKSLLGIINDILDTSKIEAGEMSLEHVDFELSSIFEELSGLFIPEESGKKLEILYNIGTDINQNLRGDPLRIRQILTNLIGNAIKFSEQGNIIVDVQRLQNDESSKQLSLRFSVTDNGIGISREQQKQLFQPFSQADSSTSRHYGGTGLGLSICKRLVELMGGKIGIESKPGKGSTFFFTLPIELSTKQYTREMDWQNKLNDSRILIVDDNPESRKQLRQLLKPLPGLQTPDEASSGSEAIKRFSDIPRSLTSGGPYQLVIIDADMPGLSGVETIWKLKHLAKHTLPATILLGSVSRQKELDQQSRELNAIVLTKPVLAHNLYQAIKQSLAASVSEDIIIDQILPTLEVKTRKELRGKRVLLAEDHDINQMIIQELLQNVGVHITCVDNGRKAVELLRQQDQHFDLILMDLQMPEMNGYAAAQQIRLIPRFKKTPIIAITAHALEQDRQKSLAAGMDSHIEKPIDIEDLYKQLLKFTTNRTDHTQPETAGENRGEERTLPKQLPGLDIQRGLMQLDGNQQLYRKIILDFARTNDCFLQQLQQNLENDDFTTARDLLHRLKGVAGNIAATELHKKIQQAETALQSGSRQELSLKLQEMGILLQQIETSAAQLEKHRSSVSIDSIILEKESVLQRLEEELIILLETNNLDAVKVFATLKKSLDNSPILAKMEPLESCIDRLDFENALKALTLLEISQQGIPEVTDE
ncbi:MAG TPA: response regulator [Geopsychrobacteraceae bacterium]|nr:response regulator [Geopsychrobacteraceae bacterium]